MKNVILLSFYAFLACSALSASEPQGKKYALLIGIDDYVKMRPLRYAKNDIEALREQLYKIGFKKENVFCLKCGGSAKEMPSKEAIMTTIEHVIGLAEKGDILFLAMTGHGIEAGDGTARFCPFDADPQNLLTTTVPISDIFEGIERCKATFKLMMIDACREDPFRGRHAGGAKMVDTLDNPPKGCVLLQSCAKGELSLEDDQFKHGIFTYYFIEGLSGKAADKEGRITLLGLMSYAGDKTRRRAYEIERSLQRPYLKGETTDFVIVDFVVGRVNVPEPYPKGTGPKPSKLLSEAILQDDLEQIRRHISHGTSLDVDNEMFLNIQSEEALAMLLRGGMSTDIFNKKSEDGWSLLHSYIWGSVDKSPSLEIVHELLSTGNFDINQVSSNGFPLMAAAVYHGDWRVFQFFLNRGVKFAATESLGNRATYLHFAAAKGKERILDFLIEKGSDVNALTNSNQSPLLYAAFHGNEVTFHHLLKKGAKLDVHFQDDILGTLLHVAVMGGNPRIVKTLLKAGADVNAKSKASNLQTPLDFLNEIAAENGVSELLKSYGAKSSIELKSLIKDQLQQ